MKEGGRTRKGAACDQTGNHIDMGTFKLEEWESSNASIWVAGGRLRSVLDVRK
jgi:hypothetical protein